MIPAAHTPSAPSLPVNVCAGCSEISWDGGRRYTCPSFRFTRPDSGASLEAPGFHPASTYEVLLANLAPELDRAEQPDDVQAVLSWAGSRLATQEVATVCDIDREEARRRLVEAGAVEQPSGTDSYWELASN